MLKKIMRGTATFFLSFTLSFLILLSIGIVGGGVWAMTSLDTQLDEELFFSGVADRTTRLYYYDHEQNGDEGLEEESAPYFVGKIVEKNERGFLLKITDSGNGSFGIGEAVQVNVDASGYPDYAVGDHLRIAFDGKVALSYPPQVTSVTSIRKTDSQGNDID